MHKLHSLIAILLIVCVLLSAMSCGKTATTSSISSSQPVINITYSANFSGETASGKLELSVGLSIENRGYDLFNTSSENFLVVVGDYSYPPSKSNLPAVDLKNQETIKGSLTFQVPPEAATTRVGYKMGHSAQTSRNIQWIKQVATTTTGAEAPAVLISYTDSYMWVKETSRLYLLIDMTIENKGYESFNTSPERFKLQLGNIIGRFETTTPIAFDGNISNEKDGAYSNLRSYDLQNGGKLNGTLAFPVPTDIYAATERYSLDYKGVRSYNIQWQWYPPQPSK
jgi:hypothetical protein